MSPRFEAFLAELYTDDGARHRFLSNPRDAARRARLADAEVEALAAIDRLGLELAAGSFALKRAKRRPRRPRWRRWFARLRAYVVP